ncbi:hypothetical protein PIB30_004753 [Stylosanthes scabra]|uniref:Protein CMSS1 n=1 Tax=Stylosanthes scabra TaxID=79078 RepID=A0ABU6S4C8_9FABA|nr:hypothetical protein [Stylosanthes scabra]
MANDPTRPGSDCYCPCGCVTVSVIRKKLFREKEGMGSGKEATQNKQQRKRKRKEKGKGVKSKQNSPSSASASEQLRFFVDEFQSAKGVKLSSLELDSLKDSSILSLPHSSDSDSDSDVKMLGNNMKPAFGESWKQVLCEPDLVPGKVLPGSPAILIVASSALRSLHLLRGFRSFTKECHAAKLFSKHMKLEEQISVLKNRVNIASGTPSRIKKLIDTEALSLSRLQVLLLDIHPDVKGYSLFTLPQVRDEFWDLFKNYFYQGMMQGQLRICIYGPLQSSVRLKGKQATLPDE